jgi:hypothetical protein
VVVSIAYPGLLVAVVLGLVTGGRHGALVVGLIYACALIGVEFLLHLAAGVYGQRSADRLWRERMASGFYKTLPPTEEDED